MFRMFHPALAICACLAVASPVVSAAPEGAGAQDLASRKTRVSGIVRDEQNAIALPGVPVALAGTDQVVYTDVDGRYTIDLPPGNHQLAVSMDGYQARTIDVTAGPERAMVVDVSLPMNRFAEEVTVTGQASDAKTSTQEAQLVLRRNAQVITDNMGSQEMKSNGDSDAAAGLQRVAGLSVVDGQFVFVRGLGERYSNTTLGGAVIPTTEPDKKVVPLDLFPTALIDSVQVAKSYTPDRSAEFAGGLVEIVPQRMVNRQVLDASYGVNYYETSTGDSIPLSPLGRRDRWGFDSGARALPGGFPASKVVRRGIFSPEVGFSRDEITAFGRLLDDTWTPERKSGKPGQTFNVSYGNRIGQLSVLGSVSQNYKEQYVREARRFYRIGEDEALEPVTEYDFETGIQRAQLGIVGNIGYQFSPAHRVSFDNFYTHGGTDEGRFFEGPNTENNFIYRNYRLQFIEQGLLNTRIGGDHFFPALGNSRVDWRASYGRASRDEPDLREVLYQQNINGTGSFLLADESQSGFRMFNTLDDDTVDVAMNWSSQRTIGGRPAVYKFGPSYVRRTRDFASRRFRYIPTNAVPLDLSLAPEALFTTANIGPAYRFNEETRPVDAYDAEQTTLGVYGMADWVLSNKARLIGGVRVERFEEEVNTFDPFGLFEQRETALIRNTDVFPGVNFVYAVSPAANLRLGYSQTVNRPEFRELASFEFTDVVGNRAVRGNPDLVRSLIQNVDARVEMFSGGRGVLAASVFYKNFSDPIERIIIASAQPVQTFQNAAAARNVGLELEAGRSFSRFFYGSLNYTFVDSEITLSDAARSVQTSQSRALAGQSKNLFNAIVELTFGGFQGRVLYNFFDDRISDVGSNGAPDIVEAGRGSVDVVLSQRVRGLNLRLSIENAADEPFVYVQRGAPKDQRRYNLGRVAAFSVGYSFF